MISRSALLLVLFAAPARAQRGQQATVLATVQRALDAIGQRDTTTLRELLLPGTRFVVTAGDTSSERAKIVSDTAVLRQIATGKEALRERIWSPVVQVHGSIATVWAPYDFHIDGRRSHCGVDAFTLVRSEGRWRITEIVYTVEERGCVDSPLGPPR